MLRLKNMREVIFCKFALVFIIFLSSWSILEAQTYDFTPNLSPDHVRTRIFKIISEGKTKDENLVVFSEKLISSDEQSTVLEINFKRMRRSINNELYYDSANLETPSKKKKKKKKMEQIKEAYRLLEYKPFMNATFQIHLDKQGNITDIKIPSSFFEEVTARWKLALDHLAKYDSEKNVKLIHDSKSREIANRFMQYICFFYWLLPDKAVSISDTWPINKVKVIKYDQKDGSRESTFTISGTCKLDSVNNNLALIKVDNQTEHKAVSPRSITKEIYQGELIFDLEAKHIVSFDVSGKMHWVGEIAGPSSKEMEYETQYHYEGSTEW